MELAVLEQDIKLVDGQLVLEVMGQLQEDIVEKMKAELVRMLRELTKSTRISIKVNVKEEIESNSKRLYTSTDKLNHLKTIHPALSDFQRRFGLETDF
jgi:predicted translin family RNA/ssDNA-binding protein